MYIKYDESELFEFFECEPVPVGDDDAGDLIFCLLYTSPSPRDTR